MDEAVAPLLATLKTNPDHFNSLVQVANLYYDGRQYPEAVKYYRLAVKSQPTNPDLLTDLGTSLWYIGDADGAIAEFQTALKYRPNHPGTLFNLGVVRWQGKIDPKGAVEAWEQLLKLNPNYPQKQEVQEISIAPSSTPRDKDVRMSANSWPATSEQSGDLRENLKCHELPSQKTLRNRSFCFPAAAVAYVLGSLERLM